MAIRALVMSGGGAKGAFQVGAIDTLVNEQGLDFDVIAGVSAGALNALILAQASGPLGIVRQVEELKRLWLDIGSSADIYRNRFAGKVLAFVLKDSVYDPSPLRNKIERYGRLDALRASSKRFRIGVSWLETGEYESIDQNHPAVLACTLASSSMPVLFPPVPVGSLSGVDGGVRNVTPLNESFEALKELAASAGEDTLEMIVLLASPLSVLEERAPWKTGLDVGKRALTMLLNEIYREDLRYALAINQAVRSHLELRARLDDQLGSAMTERILAGLEFPFAPPQYRAVQIRAAVPDRDFADALEFDPRKIREAMDAGRAAARHLLEERELSAMLDHLETKQQPLAA